MSTDNRAKISDLQQERIAAIVEKSMTATLECALELDVQPGRVFGGTDEDGRRSEFIDGWYEGYQAALDDYRAAIQELINGNA